MPIHIIKLIDRQEVATHTWRFTFSKPDNFIFKPGQYAGFTLINPTATDALGNTRRFSLLSTPEDAHLAIAIRILPEASAFKKVLHALPIGSELKLAGPTGVFTLHEDISTPAVLLAGGIGITPFYSMIRHVTAQQSPQTIHLFYGNASQNDAAFLAELMQLQQKNSHFKCIPTIDKADTDWQGETGFISHTMLKKYINNLDEPIYYICGSPKMVTALQELLVEMGIDEARIKVEDFPGY